MPAPFRLRKVACVWPKAGLPPSQWRHHMVSNDPNFESNSAGFTSFHVKLPTRAAVLCADERTAIQALDPLLSRRPERSGFGYFQSGTFSRYALSTFPAGKSYAKRPCTKSAPNSSPVWPTGSSRNSRKGNPTSSLTTFRHTTPRLGFGSS